VAAARATRERGATRSTPYRLLGADRGGARGLDRGGEETVPGRRVEPLALDALASPAWPELAGREACWSQRAAATTTNLPRLRAMLTVAASCAPGSWTARTCSRWTWGLAACTPERVAERGGAGGDPARSSRLGCATRRAPGRRPGAAGARAETGLAIWQILQKRSAHHGDPPWPSDAADLPEAPAQGGGRAAAAAAHVRHSITTNGLRSMHGAQNSRPPLASMSDGSTMSCQRTALKPASSSAHS
jgi:hypothetical protein